ncbi:DNA glycosylase superfamily protein [Striga asiatica]|uniref:DNA glycosylase superfamily protein n=1 Tax=Striga asiatica TaxID=4170 RepID=A0A5A7PMU4_STRAF|nr:DNA glycosylase superfamily protein [Striga asiatica]
MESIFKAALATPKHKENSAQPSQPAETIADLPSSSAQDEHPPSQSTSQDPKIKRRKLTKRNGSNAKKTKQSSKKYTGSKPVLEQLDPLLATLTLARPPPTCFQYFQKKKLHARKTVKLEPLSLCTTW